MYYCQMYTTRNAKKCSSGRKRNHIETRKIKRIRKNKYKRL